jgi:hypothetical protein
MTTITMLARRMTAFANQGFMVGKTHNSSELTQSDAEHGIVDIIQEYRIWRTWS